jgi:hypothetical protein
MNSDLPPEAHHYRRSQTPESPRPLHLPEPSNIPVLQNQMDPVFNDTATYDIPLDASSSSKASDASQVDHAVQAATSQRNEASAQPDSYPQGQNYANIENSSPYNIVLNGATENQAVSTNYYAHNSNASAPDLQRTLDSLAQFTENANATPTREQPASGGEASNEDDVLPTTEVSTSGSHIQPISVPRPGSPDTVSKDGVNYQSLLDSLSQSAATAPIADTLTASTTVSASEETTRLQIGCERPLPVGAGLPPRPPPQEKPAIHPNYSPNESIRSYHHLPPQNITSAPYQAQSASYRPSADAGTIGRNIPPPQANTRAANGLPPPPVATFQQSPASVPQIQSPSAQSLRDVGGRGTKSPSLRQQSEGVNGEEQPWAPDVQKKYDQFLHDERIYVTEGVWDRFPSGSRLFVGTIGSPFSPRQSDCR